MIFWNFSFQISQVKSQEPSVTRAEVDSLIESDDFFARYEGANLLFTVADFDTTWAYETLIKGIRIESEELKKTGFHFKYFGLNPDQIYPIYVNGLAALSKNSSDRLKAYWSSSIGEVKDWLTVALGLQADSTVHGNIREIISTTPNIILKANALRAIAEYGDTTDLPLITRALTDTLAIIEVDNMYEADSETPSHYNPVIPAAVYALNKLGYDNTWDDDLNPIIWKKK